MTTVLDTTTEAERAVLAATFIASSVVDRLILDHALEPDDFDHPHHKLLWQTIQQLHADGTRIEPLVLAARLDDQVPRLAIDDLPAHAGEIANLHEHARLVKRAALRRRWRTAGARLLEAADTDDEGMVAQAEQLLATPTATDDTWDTRKLGEDACDFLSDTRSVGIPTGIPRLDNLLAGGLRAGDMTALGAWTSMGKALDLDTAVPTPAGWRTMRDLQVGDLVYGSNGWPTPIIATTQPMTGRPCYLLRFDDGAEIVADEQHQWLTWTDAARRSAATSTRRVLAGGPLARPQQRATPAIVTTGEIAATATVASRNGRSNHSVRCSPPFAGRQVHLPVDPYVLGAWLGDGTTASAAITSADPELVGFIAERGYPITKRAQTYSYGIGGGLQVALREIGVLGDKHIPEAYQRASIEQRLALMQGLMDTDGTVGRAGRCEFAVTNERLASDFHELAIGLGLKPTWSARPAMLNGRQCGTQYRVGFVTRLPVCRLQRKRERLPRRVSEKTRHRYIVHVERIDSRPVKCIQVAAADGLFQVTRSRVLTHNSALVDTILHDASLAGYRCHAYLNEMSPRDRTLRTLARISGVKYGHLVRRELDQHTAPRVLQAAQRIPFGLTDCSQWSADQIARHVRANRWDLWTLDLVHNIPYERESELHRIVATLAAAARSTGSHLLLVTQFNEARAVGETLPMPVARDIRGSGMIKNLAANVLLLHRQQRNHDGFVTTDLDGIIKIDKSRHGRLGAADVVFDPDRMRFVAPNAALRPVEGDRDAA